MAPLYPHDVLIRWAVQQGGFFHDDVEIIHTPEKGFHIIARRNAKLETNTQVVTCPMPCTMSILNIIDAEGGFTCRGIKIPPAFIRKQPRETVERFFLMEHYLVGKKSWWAPYIATLPTPEEVRHLQFENTDDLAWIYGTNLAFALEKQMAQWKGYYEAGLEQLIKLNWQNAKKWKTYLGPVQMGIGHIYLPARPMGRFSRSRATDFRNGSGDEHSDFEHLTKLFSDGFPVLVPVLDILNYRPLAQVEWQARFSYVGLEVLEPVNAGEEVCNNYGPRDNETLLLGYNFAVLKNPFDHFSVALRFPPELSLEEFRTPAPILTNRGPPYNVAPLKPRDPELKCYVFNPEHPRATDAKSLETALFSLDLLDGISTLRATDREWQAMYSLKKTCFAEGLEKGRFEDSRNLLATMSQLLTECTARLKTLKQTSPSGLAPRNLKQIFAQIYRESQVDILQIAVCLCEFVLRRAMGNGDDSQTLNVVCQRSNLDDSQIARLEVLRHRHKCMSMHDEFFSFDHMQHELPETFASTIHDTLADLGKERRLNDAKLCVNNVQEGKVQFCIILSALLAEKSQGTVAAPRFKSWLDQLTHWYPPDDPNWNYVPDRRPTAPENAPPQLLLDLLDSANALLQQDIPERVAVWLEPKMLAWGWNVMEEEGVSVPLEIIDGHQSFKPCESAFMLYFPQIDGETS